MKTVAAAVLAFAFALPGAATRADAGPLKPGALAVPARTVGAYGYAAQNAADEARPTVPATSRREGSTFACDGDRTLKTRFESRRTQSVAVVDAGDGPHALPLQPWDGGEPRITWSDGRRTLQWSAGVQLMWMDGGAHLACGRAQHHH